MTPRFGIPLRNDSTLSLGGLSTQPRSATTSTSEDRSRFGSGGTGVGSFSGASTNPGSIPNILPGSPFLQTNPAVQLLRPLFPFRNIKTYDIDNLSVAQTTIINGQFEPIAKNGISPLRPEILSVIDFLPIYTGDSSSRAENFFLTKNTTPAGDLIDLQYQASNLRQETLVRMMSNIEKAAVKNTNNSITQSSKITTSQALIYPKLLKGNSKKTPVNITENSSRARLSPREEKIKEIQNKINEIRTEYDQTIRDLDSTVSFFSNALSTIEIVKKSLNLKTIPSNLYNRNFLSLDRFFEKKMQYNLAKFSSFSDTKIILQLLSDFRSILETYSFSLLDIKDDDRVSDTSPIKIDQSYTISKSFNFNISTLRSSSRVINATEPNFFNSFINSLPENPDDRIKILTTLISKEYRVSKGLGQKNIQLTLAGRFNAQPNGNPFDNIIGEVGSNIFEKPEGTNSLSSLLYVTDLGGGMILPFESKYIDSEEQRQVYVPGSNYFVDSIINVNQNTPAFNTKPYTDYVTKFNTLVNSARGIIEDIFDFDNPTSPLISTKINDSFLNAIKNNLSTLTDLNLTRNLNLNQVIVSALFKLANRDPQLKNLLFQYLCLAGITANKLTVRSEKREIYNLLANDLVSTTNLTAAAATGIVRKLNDNEVAGNLSVILGLIARQIEDRVFTITNIVPPSYASTFDFSETEGLRRPGIRAFTNDGLNTAISRRSFSPNTFDTTTSSVSSVNNFTKIKFQKGKIYRALIHETLNPGSGTTNFIQEFIKISDSLQDAAVSQGTNSYLLDDGTRRTRYNYLSTSTQLLMIFEIFASYINKYVYCTYERSDNLLEGMLTVDNFGNKNTLYAVNEILALPVTPITKDDISNKIQKSNFIDLSTKRNLDLSFLQQGRNPTLRTGLDTRFGTISTIAGNNSSQRNSPNTSTSANISNQVSREVQNAFDSSGDVNELISSNYQEASSLANISTYIVQNSLNPNLILSYKSPYAVARANLFTIRNKINDEEKTIANILHILYVISSWLLQGSRYATTFFNQNTLLTFLKNNNITTLDLLQNPTQIRNSVYTLDLIKEKIPNKTFSQDLGTTYNNVIISDIIQPEENRALNSLLQQFEYTVRNKADKKIKLLTVGVPSGFSKQLSDRVDIRNINERTFRDKQFDVISVNVYKRDARFDDLVFKPQKFLFDISLYQKEIDVVNIKPRALESFRNLIGRATVTDYEDTKSKQQINYRNISLNPKYNFLTNDQKRELINNHLTSYLLASYINLLTGIRFYEDEFLEKEYTQGTQINSKVLSLVYDYIVNVIGIQIPQNLTLEEMLKLPNLNADAKDILTLVSYGSFVFEPEYIKASVIQPKLFERIFTIPLDITKFEIDESLTIATDSGRLAYRSSYIQEKLTRVNNKIYLKENTDGLIFEDYFITIEAGF